jgi:hypothetical protein
VSSRPHFSSSGNPLAQIASLVLFGLLLVVAFLAGAVILAIVLGVAALTAVWLLLRAWWWRRGFERGARRAQRADGADRMLIDAEYTVVEKREHGSDARARDSSDTR